MDSWKLCAGRGEFSSKMATNKYAPNWELEPIHLDINLKIDITDRSAKGFAVNRLRANTNGANSIVLNAVDLEIINVECSSEVTWSYDGSNLSLSFTNDFELNEEREVKISYIVTDPVAGLYFSYPNDKNPNAPETLGSDHEAERARYWIPSIDQPSVRPTINFTLTAKSSYTILAIGKLVKEVENGDGTKTAYWEHNYPCPLYIAAIALGELSEYNDQSIVQEDVERPIAYYAAKEFSPEILKMSFDRTPQMIEWLSEKVGHSIAWNKYYQFALRGIGGAMENQSLVSWDDMYLVDENSKEELSERIDDTNVHELAHTFFGDMVVIKDFGHGWLKESWATYVTALWIEDSYGQAAFQYDMFLNAEAYFDEADNRYVRPIVTRKFEDPWEMFDRHLYPGGSWRIHMLRRLLGDEKFWTAINDYIDTYQGKVVETVDFKRILETHSGLNLDSFFDQWVLTPNKYPDLKLGYSFNKEKGLAEFTYKQKQLDPKKYPDRIPFEFDIEVSCRVNEEFVNKRVRIDKDKGFFAIKTDKKPELIEIDPKMTSLFKLEFNPGKEINQTAIKEGTSVITRILAARNLIKTGKRSEIENVVEVMKNEEFYGVRNHIYAELGKSNAQAAFEGLKTLTEVEVNPKCYGALASAFGKHYRTESREHLLLLLKKSNIGEFAKADVYTNLGKLRDYVELSDFDEAFKTPGFLHRVTRGALIGLGNVRSKKALKKLIQITEEYETPNYLRNTLFASLASAASWTKGKKRTKVIKLLEAGTQEEMDRIRMSAARGLRLLKAKSSLRVLDDMKALHPHQDIVAIENIQKQIRLTKDAEEMKELQITIEDLKKEIATIKDDLEKLKN